MSDKPGRRYQSDVVVDLIQRYGFPHAALNPGASFRGLHDSLVHHGDGNPPLITCTHEKIAVQMAHGYARATSEPMIAIVHNLVGLLHAPMAVYHAYLDRAPVFLIGAVGPMEESKRRPYIDWVHSAQGQGEALRNFLKWDVQPTTIDYVPDAFARAYSVMMSGRRGPVYFCLDAGLQEAELDREIALPREEAACFPAPPAPNPDDLEKAADLLANAERPAIVVDFAADGARGWDHVVELAETLGASVWDANSRLNFPSEHPLNLSMDADACYEGVDCVLLLDVGDFEKPTHVRNIADRSVRSAVPGGARWIDVGWTDVEISKWSMDYGRTLHADLRMTADAAVAARLLTGLLRKRIAADSRLPSRIAARSARIAERHRALRERWRREAEEDWDARPMTPDRLALEVWEAIRGEDWVLAAGTLQDAARRLWNFDRPYRHAGRSMGAGTQIGLSLGVALAHRGTGRLVVDLQPDGDLMYDAGALWIAAKHQIPLLAVMFNNRAYYNDWNHQAVIAKKRGTDPSLAYVGTELAEPDPDFAGLARAQGWWAEGPIEDPNELQPVLRRAIEDVRRGRPALVDAVCRRGKGKRALT